MDAAHPERLLACLKTPLAPATLQRLRSSRRLRPRLQALLIQSLGATASGDDSGAGEEDRALAEAILACPNLREAGVMAGAVWHARSLKLLVSGPAVGDLAARIGRRAHGFGLRHAALAVHTAPITEPAALAAAIEQDGLRCLGAAFTAAGAALRLRLLVRLPPGTPAGASSFDEAYRRHAPAILALVASEWNEPRHDA